MNDDLKYYIVFPARHWRNPLGQEGISWDDAVGVFRASNPADACLAAAKKAGQMSTMFAIEGFPYGLDMESTDVTELGGAVDPISRLERMGNSIAERLGQLVPGNSAPALEEGEQDG